MGKRLDWEKAKRDEKRKRDMQDSQRDAAKKPAKAKKVHPNSMAARKWGRDSWRDRP